VEGIKQVHHEKEIFFGLFLKRWQTPELFVREVCSAPSRLQIDKASGLPKDEWGVMTKPFGQEWTNPGVTCDWFVPNKIAKAFNAGASIEDLRQKMP
jgi:hypothetical protein